MPEAHDVLTRSQVRCHDEGFELATRTSRSSPILWLNLVCLDAPIVAVIWQWLFARNFNVSLSIPTRAGLFLTAWLIYLADRFADGWTLRAEDPRSMRQQFCHRHRRLWIAAITVIALVDLWIILRQLDRATVLLGTLLGAISIAYLAVNHWLGKIWRLFPVKEICIGSLFAAGTAMAVFLQTGWSFPFVVSFCAFAALCSLNCISIAIWERDLDCAQHRSTIATRWPGIGSRLKLGSIALALFTCVIGLMTKAPAPVFFCIGASATFLGVLDLMGKMVSRDERVALADLALLTPLFLMLLGIA
jgi:hypothetical protein